jgi:hypothetical protein
MVYDAYVALTDEVSEAEQDPYLRLFSRLEGTDPRASLWLEQWLVRKTMLEEHIEEIPGYEEVRRKMIREGLEAMPLEERLAGLAPEQRLRGLTFEQQILALPVEILSLLPESELAKLSPEVFAVVQKRLGGSNGSNGSNGTDKR